MPYRRTTAGGRSAPSPSRPQPRDWSAWRSKARGGGTDWQGGPTFRLAGEAPRCRPAGRAIDRRIAGRGRRQPSAPSPPTSGPSAAADWPGGQIGREGERCLGRRKRPRRRCRRGSAMDLFGDLPEPGSSAAGEGAAAPGRASNRRLVLPPRGPAVGSHPDRPRGRRRAALGPAGPAGLAWSWAASLSGGDSDTQGGSCSREWLKNRWRNYGI